MRKALLALLLSGCGSTAQVQPTMPAHEPIHTWEQFQEECQFSCTEFRVSVKRVYRVDDRFICECETQYYRTE